MNPDPDPGGPKAYGSDGSGSEFGPGSATLTKTYCVLCKTLFMKIIFAGGERDAARPALDAH
jgi:hypothetical protein